LPGSRRGSESLLELEETDVPANYIVRLRAEQASLRRATLRMYHIQREVFLPSAKAMITSLVTIILVMLMFTDMGGQLESLVTLESLQATRYCGAARAPTGAPTAGSAGVAAAAPAGWRRGAGNATVGNRSGG
jgi:hypothetical protein